MPFSPLQQIFDRKRALMYQLGPGIGRFGAVALLVTRHGFEELPDILLQGIKNIGFWYKPPLWPSSRQFRS